MEEELDALAAEFFKTFSRMEYALKAANFHCGDGRAKASWPKFARSYPDIFDDLEVGPLKDAFEYLSAQPPKRQMLKNDLPEWKAPPFQNISETERMVIYICIVRNNLFHGGKFNGSWFEPERSHDLLSHSLTIMRACLEASEEVSEAYHG